MVSCIEQQSTIGRGAVTIAGSKNVEGNIAERAVRIAIETSVVPNGYGGKPEKVSHFEGRH